MELTAILTFIHENSIVFGIIIFLASFIEIPKIKINIWQLIGNNLFDKTSKKLDKLEHSIENIDHKLCEHVREEEELSAKSCRRNILNFNSEVIRGTEHTEEQWNQILEDIDFYEDFCYDHPKFQNSKAISSINNLKSVYLKVLKENKFL